MGTLSPFMVDGVSLAVYHFVTRLKQEKRMKFYVMGTQPSTDKAISLSKKVFDNLQEALHYRDTVSPAWQAFVVVQITEEVQQGE